MPAFAIMGIGAASNTASAIRLSFIKILQGLAD
jgi:hypothetical protein